MNKTAARVLAGLSVSALALTAGSTTVGSTAATASSRPSTLTFDVSFSTFFLLDFGPQGVREVTSFHDPFDPSKGDQTIFNDQLLRGGTVVGSQAGTCTITKVDLQAQDKLMQICQVGFDLPGGQIMAQGLTTENPLKKLVLTGGTGRYAGAQGTVTVSESENATGTVVFRLSR